MLWLSAPPRPREPRRRSPAWIVPVLAALLGTGGCGAIVTAAAQVAGAIRAGDAAVAQRLETIEGKLDGYRDDQADLRARVGGVERANEAIESQARGLDNRISNLERSRHADHP